MQNDIRKNPTFISQFPEMCAKVGVDPLASNKGFWAELLGIGDFYYEIASSSPRSSSVVSSSSSISVGTPGSESSQSLAGKSTIDEPSSPYFLHHSNSPGLVLVSQSLTGDNYAS
ncbi:hypothetical protein LWI28_015834 [Acer negundo]|uniref:Retrotransposon Copia-like N-terminal domain-containing protein n=1 Tax=Acer negundo TaxID=4023 RepID=A0AAD5NXG9_ACENE|nr:hypothetical protein LWI28_015834 [Acer negundo]